MRIGLTFEEFVELRQKQETFPIATAEVSSHLRSRGYDCKPVMLEHVVATGVVTLSQPDAWTREAVETAAEYLEHCEIYTPYAAMCQTLLCRYIDFLRPLREAAERESQKYGRRVPENDQYFVMHRVPPRSVTNAQGELVKTTPSVISFTICDDVRERIECGEEI